MTQPKKEHKTEEAVPVELHPEATPSAEATKDLVAMDNPGIGSLVPGKVTGEVGGSDIKLPTLRIIQKMSANESKLDFGTITANGDVVVEGADGTAIVTVVSIQKKYEEVLAFGAGIPKRFTRLEDAVADGFKLCRSKADRDSGADLVEETAMVLLACHQPEGAMDRSFPFQLGETRVVPAIWFLRSYAYGAIAKTIFSKINFDLRGQDLLKARWRISTEKRSNSYGEFFVPQIVLLSDENTDEFVDAVRSDISFA